MADIVNLRQVRKEKTRAGARAKADENAMKFGQTKAQRRLSKAESEKAARDLDGHQRTPK